MTRLIAGVALVLCASLLTGCGTKEQWLRASQGFLDGTNQGLAAQKPLYLYQGPTPYLPPPR